MKEMEMTEEFMSREEGIEKPEGMDEAVAAADELESTMFEAMAPSGVFTEKALNTFVKGINEALSLFPGAEPVADFEGDVDGVMPENVTRALGMIKSAFTDYSGDEPFTFQDITDDRSLKEVAGKLMAMKKDQAFRAFLAKPMNGDDIERIEAVSITREPEEAPQMSGENEDELLMSRLS